MSLTTTVAYVLHTVFAGAWVGAVVFTTWKVLPLAKESELEPAILQSAASGLSTFSRTSALVLPATGLWMAWTQYNELAGLLVPPRGHVVLTMTALWLVMTGMTEVGAARIRDAASDGKVRTAGRDADTFLKVASVVGLLILVLGGYLAAPPL
jgi:putative copper export protein